MHLTEGEIYHVYNRGNNKQRIFITTENYYYFLKKIDLYVKPVCDILAWCLMPNHFHFLIHANPNSTPVIKDGSFERQHFSQSIKQLLSSYTKAINKQEKRTGSLFQQKTKALCVSDDPSHLFNTFHYIHQNPMKAGLCKRMEDWRFSSFREYSEFPENSICNKNLALKKLDLRQETFYLESYKVIRDQVPTPLRCRTLQLN